jgi:hypothetical protein
MGPRRLAGDRLEFYRRVYDGYWRVVGVADWLLVAADAACVALRLRDEWPSPGLVTWVLIAFLPLGVAIASCDHRTRVEGLVRWASTRWLVGRARRSARGARDGRIA